MPKVNSNNTRRTPAFYDFTTQSGQLVQINLNGYTARCTVTGDLKRFHHGYLAKMIKDKYDNNIDVFELNYVSRAGVSVTRAADKQHHIRSQIQKLQDRIVTLQSQLV